MDSKRIQSLIIWGADAHAAIGRMLNDEVFYLNLVEMFITSSDWFELEKLLSENKYKEAFIVSHRMKGSCADLSLTPLYEALCELTDDLRGEVRPTLSDNIKKVYKLKDTLTEAF